MEIFKFIRGEAEGTRISTKRLTVLLNRLIVISKLFRRVIFTRK